MRTIFLLCVRFLISVILWLDRRIQFFSFWIARSGRAMTLFGVIALPLLAGCASAIHMAAGQGDVKTLSELLKGGADIHDVENSGGGYVPQWGTSYGMIFIGGTPLHYASYYCKLEAMKFLIERGANVNRVTRTSPLYFASMGGCNEGVKLLLEKGADINAKDVWGSPLAVAAVLGHGSIVKLLMEKGADTDDATGYLMSVNKQKFTQGAQLIESISKNMAKQRENSSQHLSQSLTKEDMEKMVQTAVDKASKDKKESKTSIAASDIDKPSFTPSDKLMADNDLAVIIGIEGYQNIPKSDFSYDDAKLVKEYAKALGFKERNIELLTDERATLSSITKTLEAWLKNKAKADSKVFVYYSGHGAPDPSTGEAYLVPYDGDPNYLSVTGYPLKRLYENLGRLQVAEVTVVLDACFSGAGGRSVLAKGARPLVMMADIKTIPSNMVILSATQGTQISTSSPEKGHGVFTYYFLKALKDGKKNLSDIYEYIKPLVEDEAKQLNVQQSPSISPELEKLKGRFLLRR